MEIVLKTNKSLFSLTHDGSVSYVAYLSKTPPIYLLRLDPLMSARIETILASVLLLPAFYALLRRDMSGTAALVATAALTTSYWFMNFSRVVWIIMDSTLIGLLLIWATLHAVKTQTPKDFIISGAFLALSLYNHMSGRIFILASLWIMFRNLTKIRLLILWATTALILFSPQIPEIINNLSRYSERARSISLMREYQNMPTQTFAQQLSIVFRGMVLFDSNISHQGYENNRLIPPGQSGVNLYVTILFIAGTIIFLTKKKINSYWLVIYISNFIIYQMTTNFVPSWSRAFSALPSIYAVAALSLNELKKILDSKNQALSTMIILAIGATVVLSDQYIYWNWTVSSEFNQAQQPSLSLREYPAWLKLQKTHLLSGYPPFTYQEWSAPLPSP